MKDKTLNESGGLMKLLQNRLFSFVFISLGLLLTSGNTNASQVVSQWYFGSWNCNIDGRPARMQWFVVDDPQTTCNGDICTTSSGVKIVGRFSDNGSAWVPLAKRTSTSTSLSIRYLGAEQNNWYLNYNTNTGIAQGWTTWRRNRYPLSCSNRRRYR